MITGKIVNTKKKEKYRPVQSYDFGSSYFCDAIISKLGFDKILKHHMPGEVDIIKALVQYIITDGGAYYLARQWVRVSREKINTHLVEKVNTHSQQKNEKYDLYVII